MYTETSQKIIDFVEKNEPVAPKMIIDFLKLNPVGVFRHLAKLVQKGILIKQGKTPKVFYSIVRAPMRSAPEEMEIAPDDRQMIEENFLRVRPDGVIDQGVSAFSSWCQARNMDPSKASQEYTSILKDVDVFKTDGTIDATKKIQKSLPRLFLDRLFYLDFYSIERFGKTALGELILYAKQSQNPQLISKIATQVRPRILELLKRFQIDAVGFIPPTIKREVQFMTVFEGLLDLPVKMITLTKIKTPVIVAQKSLSKLEERIENARLTFAVEETHIYRNILLIDDAVGSGATMNEIASQIKRKDLCSGSVIGLGLVGSYSGFDVIHEV